MFLRSTAESLVSTTETSGKSSPMDLVEEISHVFAPSSSPTPEGGSCIAVTVSEQGGSSNVGAPAVNHVDRVITVEVAMPEDPHKLDDYELPRGTEEVRSEHVL